MKTNNFVDFKHFGDYLYSTCKQDEATSSEHNGAYRMKIAYAPCGQVSLCAQLIMDKGNSHMTFRKWNPLKLNVPWGSETSADIDEDCGGSWYCYICKCVNCCMDTLFEEVVYIIAEEDKEAEPMLKQSDEAVAKMGSISRPIAIFLCMLGFFLLFSPIVELLKWIPLVGMLLGMIVQVVAAIVGFVVGGTIACLVLALAWLRFRPCIGISLLLCVGLGIAAIFVIPNYV